MKKALGRVLAVLVLIVVSMSGGAALYAGFGPEPDKVAELPILDGKELGHLVNTYLKSTPILDSKCREPKVTEVDLQYHDDGHWVVITEGGCGFVINDRTGEVTGP